MRCHPGPPLPDPRPRDQAGQVPVAGLVHGQEHRRVAVHQQFGADHGADADTLRLQREADHAAQVRVVRQGQRVVAQLRRTAHQCLRRARTIPEREPRVRVKLHPSPHPAPDCHGCYLHVFAPVRFPHVQDTTPTGGTLPRPCLPDGETPLPGPATPTGRPPPRPCHPDGETPSPPFHLPGATGSVGVSHVLLRPPASGYGHARHPALRHGTLPRPFPPSPSLPGAGWGGVGEAEGSPLGAEGRPGGTHSPRCGVARRKGLPSERKGGRGSPRRGGAGSGVLPLGVMEGKRGQSHHPCRYHCSSCASRYSHSSTPAPVTQRKYSRAYDASH